LTPPERGDALGAVAWTAVAHLALRCTSHAVVRRMVLRVPSSARRRRFTAVDCEAALRRAAVVLPRSSCLARAVAGASLLRRAGRASTLNIGVRFPDSTAHRLDAHAWLECDGRIVTGAPDAAGYQTLLRDAIPAAP
jgi:hypothetical protein